ncbi:isochorismatase [Betaproteobacteria bacterium]|nr:isochorismatase [Betaproteobacteria bacterium]GHT97612.1 isochorismatase [Betaproteobacteria bacterium]GHU28295.1 isochorismatase [Betaproteobacteria bacterium]
MTIAFLLVDIQNDYFPGGTMENVGASAAASEAAKLLAPNSFKETPLLEHLRNASISRLLIAGMMTHMCIDTTTRAAADLGFSCSVAHDACATRTLSFNGVQVPAEHVQTAYLAALNGLFAHVASTSALLSDP